VASSSIHESWGVLLAALARRDTTAQLVVTGRDHRVVLQLECGRVVAAASQAIADSALRIALIHDFVLPRQVSAIEQQLAADPTRDEIEVIQEAASLTEALVEKLHARVLVHRIARTFAFEHTSVELRDERPAVVSRHGIEIRQPIYAGARAHLTIDQLRDEVRALGSFFVLHADAPLGTYGFREAEQPVLTALARGLSVAELDRLPGVDPMMAHAVVYALACCRDVDTAPPAIAMARGTVEDVRNALDPRVEAEQVAHRAALMLRTDPEAAMREITRAIALAPDAIDYRTTLAWARFCCTNHKREIASEVRSELLKVARLSRRPEIARFYLGRLERTLGRDREALVHFQEVLAAQPRHPEVCAEVRAILTRLGPVERVQRSRDR
jgi:tetratricopeptide (TPR) repeat protein